MKPVSDILRTLVERGFVKDATDLQGLDTLAHKGPITAYIGFDATAPSLHVGSLIQLMVIRHLKAAGHNPIGLLGHATTLVGDPSDKDAARPMLTPDDIVVNTIGIQHCLDKVVGCIKMVDNAEWFTQLGYLAFLRKFGPFFTVNRMLTMDSVKRRLDRQQPLTVLEFNYMMMQSIDFLSLFEKENCRLQIGGSDQWSNILGGVELVRRIKQEQVFGLVTPLMTDMAGQKMGKTATGQAIWLDPSRTSVFDFWQFWRNVEDGKVREFLGLFTDLPMKEVERLASLTGQALNDAKRILATEVTTIVHGREAALDAERAAAAVFDRNDLDASMPTITAPADLKTKPTSLADLLIQAGFSKSKNAARQLAAGGGVRVNGIAWPDANVLMKPEDFNDGELRLSAGKKRHVRVLVPSQNTPPIKVEARPNNDGSADIWGLYPFGVDREWDLIEAGFPSMAEANEHINSVYEGIDQLATDGMSMSTTLP